MTPKKYVSLSKLSTFLDNLKSTFASLGHSHSLSDITDYKVDSQLSPTSTNPVQNKVLDAEFDTIGKSFSAIESALDDKVDTSDMSNYYTKTDIDSLEIITIQDIDAICIGQE